MNHFIFFNKTRLLLIIGMTFCQSCIIKASETHDSSGFQDTCIVYDINHNNPCDYFYLKDPINDTLHFDFENRDDFGPVYLSENEIKEIYCEIKRGNIDAYKILCLHYFYSNSQCIPRNEMDILICITDFLAEKHSYYTGYLTCANIIFDYLTFNTDDSYAATMIRFYEKYFDFSKSIPVAKKLYDFFCGKYPFQYKDSIKANYYKEFISDK